MTLDPGMSDRLLKLVVMWALFMPAILIAVLSMSRADLDYLGSLESTSAIYRFIGIFFVFYGTPSYVYIAAISKLSGLVKAKPFNAAVKCLEDVSSLPLFLLSFGFAYIYFVLKNIELDEDKHAVRIAVANITGMILMAGFYARVVPSVVIALFSSSILCFALYWLLDARRKKKERELIPGMYRH